jgi:hypothetical protein
VGEQLSMSERNEWESVPGIAAVVNVFDLFCAIAPLYDMLLINLVKISKLLQIIFFM